MNNEQFRRLLLDNADSKNREPPTAAANAEGTASSLGSRKAGFTPRAVKGGGDGDFARQMKERQAAFQPTKKFKSAAPKGVKLGAGYTDRARARAEDGDDAGTDEKESRIRALEEQVKLGQISQQTFEELRDAITGGDLGSTHLVKGLDRKLLERVRRGEDVLGTKDVNADGTAPLDADEELDKLGEREVETVKKATIEKKGNAASPVTLAGTKRTRDEIMAELKAQRKAAADAKASTFANGRWKRIGEVAGPKVQIDHKGRQVIITVDKNGAVKKKIRKIAREEEQPQPEAAQAVVGPLLGSDVNVPNASVSDAPVDVDDDDDIFEGVGVEYNPLGDDDDDDDGDDASSNSDDDRQNAKQKTSHREAEAGATQQRSSDDLAQVKHVPKVPRNYFINTTQATHEEDQSKEDRLAGVQQLLKKAAKLDAGSTANAEDENQDERPDEQAARLKRRAQMLAQQDRDFEDMDMGFGSSRYDDGEEDGDNKVKLSEWKDGNAESDDGKKGGANKTKRKSKKRKGDANNMADIMRVIDGRKGGSGK